MPRGLLPWGCNMNFLHWGCKRESRESCLPWEELGEYRGFLKEIKCVFSHEKKKKRYIPSRGIYRGIYMVAKSINGAKMSTDCPNF